VTEDNLRYPSKSGKKWGQNSMIKRDTYNKDTRSIGRGSIKKKRRNRLKKEDGEGDDRGG